MRTPTAPLESTPKLRFGPGMGVHPQRAGALPPPRPIEMPAFRHLGEAVVHWAGVSPTSPSFHLIDAEDRLTTLSRADVLVVARKAAAACFRRGIRQGDRVFLCFDTGPELLAAFFGCTLLGAVPVLAEPPLGFARMMSWQERARKMVEDANVKLLVVEEGIRVLAEPVAARGQPVISACELREESSTWHSLPEVDPEELAFIQFTSGTTADAKGVMVSHRAVLENIRRSAEVSGYNEADQVVGWIPLHHDMGLVGSTLSAFLHGIPAALMSPLSFIFGPERWPWAMHYFRGTLCGAPNFAFQLCVKKIPEARLEGLDLSRWRIAYNGAEAIDHRTVEGFIERFGPRGFRPQTMFPVYGMAEVALVATFPVLGKGPRMDVISRQRLEVDGCAEPAQSADPQAMTLVGVGQPLPGHQLKIVDTNGAELPERRQGQILLRGSSLASGYVQQPEATARTFRDGWLWTGDLGYLADGELFISGRIKDLIIKGGRNYHPHAFELAAAEVPGVRAGWVAAVGCHDPESGTEELVVLFETAVEELSQRAALVALVARRVQAQTGLRPDRVIALAPRMLPKTSSGKLQRGRILELLRGGGIESLKAQG